MNRNVESGKKNKQRSLMGYPFQETVTQIGSGISGKPGGNIGQQVPEKQGKSAEESDNGQGNHDFLDPEEKQVVICPYPVEINNLIHRRPS